MGTRDLARFFIRLTRFSGRVFWLHSAFAIFFAGSRVVPGLLTQAIFDDLTGERPAGFDVGTLLAATILWQIVRILSSISGQYYGRTFFLQQMLTLQSNTLRSMLRLPGATGVPVSSGDAVNRLNHDAGEVGDFPLWVPWVMGHALFAIIAFIVMARINLGLTLVVVLPLFGVILVTNAARERLLSAHRVSRQAGSQVTGFLGEVFGAVLAIQVANAGASVLGRFEALNERRRSAGLQVQLMNDVLEWAWRNLSDLGVGIVLLLSGPLIQTGAFTVGDFTLFTSYLWFLVRFPGDIGGMLADFRTQEVSIERLLALGADAEPESLLVGGALRKAPAPAPPLRAPRNPLKTLHLKGLTFRYPKSGGGIEGVDLELAAGSVTVITGEVGAGKTTLLRTLLGLLPAHAGQILWNGTVVVEPASWFQPPRAAYTPQIPRLFSLSLRDNITLGLEVDVSAAAQQAVLEEDLDQLEAGLDTQVGPRGVKLSGGQVQRAAAARMLARRPSLLVVDDLSSALDVETEKRLWRRLLGPNASDDRAERQRGERRTILAVSHRRSVWQRANQIVVLEGGRITDAGTLEALRARSAAFRRLWRAADGKGDD